MTVVKWSAVLASAVALMPFYLFRRGGRPRHRSRLVRTAHAWIDAIPLRMCFPYVAGATLALGIVPLNATIWAAGGMAVVLLFPVGIRGKAERFEITRHIFDQRRTAVPRVDVHTRKPGIDDPRRSTRLRRGTVSHRLLRTTQR